MTIDSLSLRFSVLMSVYDGELAQNLFDSLRSLTESTATIDELVLVEDGPLRSELRDVIEHFRASLPIVSVRLETNQGLPGALNAGLKRCRHEYVARFDSDDLALPHRFQAQLCFLEANPEVCAVGSDIEEFDAETGQATGYRRLPTKPEALRRFAKMRSPMNHPSVMFRRSAILRAGGYPGLPYFEDYALWVRCLAGGALLANLPEPLLKMRSGAKQLSRRRGWRYAGYELAAAAEFRRIGFLSWLEWARFVVLRVPVRLLPIDALRVLYHRTLRSVLSQSER